MSRSQFLVLLSTFLVGMFSGAYMYVTVFAPEYTDHGLADDPSRASLIIIGEQFGGCQMLGNVCATFRLTGDRQYEYIPAYPLSADTPAPQTGTIDSATMQKLNSVLAAADFLALKQPGDTCRAVVDGIDYKYIITRGEQSEQLNSCSTSFYGSRLYNELLLIWGQVMKADATGASETGEVRGPAEILIDRFGAE